MSTETPYDPAKIDRQDIIAECLAEFKDMDEHSDPVELCLVALGEEFTYAKKDKQKIERQLKKFYDIGLPAENDSEKWAAVIEETKVILEKLSDMLVLK